MAKKTKKGRRWRNYQTIQNYLGTLRYGARRKATVEAWPILRAPPRVERAEIWFDSMAEIGAGFTTFIFPYCGKRSGNKDPVADFQTLLPFRAQGFEIRKGSEFFTIDDIVIGVFSQFAGGSIPASVFQEGNEVSFRVSIVAPGDIVQIRVTNFSSAPLRFRARLLGLSLIPAPESRP